jgi:uncharacterized damage-inducible protein DinB
MTPVADEREVLLNYLDFFRDVVRAKVGGMALEAQARAAVASGWTPLELLNHLRHVERRWLEWGFAGQPVSDPWADQQDGRWCTDMGLSDQLDRQAVITRRVVEANGLDDAGAPGERWNGQPPATLRRVLLHLIQEYARHCGHIDIVRELTDGSIGEDTA